MTAQEGKGGKGMAPEKVRKPELLYFATAA